jgi:hypothetical protein
MTGPIAILTEVLKETMAVDAVMEDMAGSLLRVLAILIYWPSWEAREDTRKKNLPG